MSLELAWMLIGAVWVLPYYRWVLMIDGTPLRQLDIVFYPLLTAAMWPICAALAIAYRFFPGGRPFTGSYAEAARYWTQARERAIRGARSA